jgi:aminoglycoside phosphotransferase (APT) family kinase protein
MLFIPATLEDVTADWLGAVLDAPVSGVQVIDAHAGTTGRAVIELTYAGATSQPPRLFVKLPPADELQRAFVCSTGMGRREALFYRHLSAEIPVRLPRCHYADADDSGEHYIMLLENLEDSGCTFRAASNQYSMDLVRSVLAAFARLHAAYWDSPRFQAELGWIEPPRQHPVGVQLVERALEQHRDTMPPVFSVLAELYLTNADAIHRLWGEGTHTLVHGDAHDGNQFLDGDTPGFLDWAIVSRAPAARDVGYYLAGVLKPGDCAQFESLLAFYRQSLQAGGLQPPNAAELLEQCRWHAAYVWVGAAATLAMGEAWQPSAYVLRTLENLHANLESLGTVPALRAALG